MRYFLLLLIMSYLLLGAAHRTALAQQRPADGMLSYKSEYGVDESLKRLVSELKENNMRIFQTVDHSAGAKSADMELPQTMLIIFGNPKAGTPLMKCARTTAIDLPQKMLIWEDENEEVHIAYNDPKYLDLRHQLGEECQKNLGKIGKALKNFATHAAGLEE